MLNLFVDFLTFLLAAGVPQNLIICTEKECTWNENDLLAHEKKVYDFFAKVPKNKNYWQVLEEENYPNGYLHIDEKFCQKKGCKHRFTEETKENFIKLFSRFF
jgi:hypothetical protein